MWAKLVDIPPTSPEWVDFPKSQSPVDTSAAEAGSKFKAPDRREPNGELNDLYRAIKWALDMEKDPKVTIFLVTDIIKKYPDFGEGLVKYISDRAIKEMEKGNMLWAETYLLWRKEIELLIFKNKDSDK